jgi:antirestriction protein ArdC
MEARKSPDDADDVDLHNEVNEFQKKMRANLVDIRRDGSALSYYDPSKNIVHLADRETFADYPKFVQEMMRMVTAATGHQQRLAREGIPFKEGAETNRDAVVQEKLVEELVSGVKMQELGSSC